MLGPSRALCSRPWAQGMPAMRSNASLNALVLAAVVEVALEPGDVSLVAVVAAALVEDLDEHLEQGVGLVLADQRGLLVDVEQQALGRDAVGLVEQAGQERVGGSWRGSCRRRSGAGSPGLRRRRAGGRASSACATYRSRRSRRSTRRWRWCRWCTPRAGSPGPSRPRWSGRTPRPRCPGARRHRP